MKDKDGNQAAVVKQTVNPRMDLHTDHGNQGGGDKPKSQRPSPPRVYRDPDTNREIVVGN